MSPRARLLRGLRGGLKHSLKGGAGAAAGGGVASGSGVSPWVVAAIIGALLVASIIAYVCLRPSPMRVHHPKVPKPSKPSPLMPPVVHGGSGKHGMHDKDRLAVDLYNMPSTLARTEPVVVMSPVPQDGPAFSWLTSLWRPRGGVDDPTFPWDATAPLPTPQPRDQPRWPSTDGYGGRIENGWYGADQYGRGGYGPDGRWYWPGQLAGGPSALSWPDGRIIDRLDQEVGPWTRVGVLTCGAEADGNGVFPLFARKRLHSGDWYNYRTMAGGDGKTPLDVTVGTNTPWMTSGDTITVAALGGSCTVSLYEGMARV